MKTQHVKNPAEDQDQNLGDFPPELPEDFGDDDDDNDDFADEDGILLAQMIAGENADADLGALR